jgi:hypothetical protein
MLEEKKQSHCKFMIYKDLKISPWSGTESKRRHVDIQSQYFNDSDLNSAKITKYPQGLHKIQLLVQ